jgi:hypothetical protein
MSKNKTIDMSNGRTVENESKRKEEPPSPTPTLTPSPSPSHPHSYISPYTLIFVMDIFIFDIFTFRHFHLLTKVGLTDLRALSP